jgi:peroxiredoxin
MGLANTLVRGAMSPELALRELNGGFKKLSELRGRVVLLHFSKTDWDPFATETGALQSVFQAQRENARFAMVTVHLDEAERAGRFVAERNLGWPQFTLQDEEARPVLGLWGLHRAVNVFLIGTDGRILDAALRPDGIALAVQKALQP